MSGFRFQFELRAVADVGAWGSPGGHRLHWFGLTDGWYRLDTEAGRLLDLAPSSDDLRVSAIDYQVARLFEDLLGRWPTVAEPVPDDVAARFLGWYNRDAYADVLGTADDATVDEWSDALRWWDARRLDLSYMRSKPDFHLWRSGADLHLRWDAAGRGSAESPWSVQSARLAVPFEAARVAVLAFCGEFLRAMSDRVATIKAEGWRRDDCALDVAQLVSEQPTREAWAARMLAQTAATDWAEVRHVLDRLQVPPAAASRS